MTFNVENVGFSEESSKSSTLIRSCSSPIILRIPPPPWRAFQTRRSSSMVKRFFKDCEEDPFLVAMKECTKKSNNNVDGPKQNGLKSLIKRGKTTFSCKNECDVREDGLVRLSKLPPLLPRNVSDH